MSSKPVIMVIGATGNIGVATLKALAPKSGRFEIRAGVRDPEKAAEKLKEFEGHVKIVKAAMGDANLTNRLRGVSRLFIVTPGVENRADLAIKTAQSAKAADVKSLVVVSVLTANKIDTIFGRQFKEIETSIKNLGIPCTFLRLPLFQENYWAFKDPIVNQSCIYMPLDPSKPYTPVVVSDAGKAAAAILVEPGRHAGKTYNIVSNRHTLNAVAAEFQRQLGKEVKYVRVPYEAAKESFMGAGLPEWQVDGILELYRFIDSGSHVTNHSDLRDYQKITGMEPTSLQDWISGVIDAFRE